MTSDHRDHIQKDKKRRVSMGNLLKGMTLKQLDGLNMERNRRIRDEEENDSFENQKYETRAFGSYDSSMSSYLSSSSSKCPEFEEEENVGNAMSYNQKEEKVERVVGLGYKHSSSLKETIKDKKKETKEKMIHLKETEPIHFKARFQKILKPKSKWEQFK